MTERRMIWGGAALLLAAGMAVRLWHIAAEPLWLDEAYSVYAADKGFGFLWQIVPRYEVHPPFYYSLLRLWTLLPGDGVAAVRALGAVAGLATTGVAAATALAAGRYLGWPRDRGVRLAIIAFALACVSIVLVEMTRQVRPYPIMILTYAAATLVLIRLAERVRGGATVGGRLYVAYLLLVEAMLWLHNLGPLYAAALGLALLAGVLRRDLRPADWAWLLGGHVVVILLYLPGLAMLLDQAAVWSESSWLRFGARGVPDTLVALYAAPGWPVGAAILLFGLAAMALVRIAGGTRLLLMLAMLAFVPVVLAIILSLTVAPVFLARALSPVAVPALLLLAVGGAAFADWRRWAALAAVVALCSNMLAVDVQARAAGPIQDWYGTVAWLAQHFRPGDRILAYPNEGALPLRMALHDKGLALPVRAIPGEVPAFDPTGWHPTGSRGVVSLPRWRLRRIADDPATRGIPTIWLLRLGAATYDKGDVFLHELHRGRYIVRSWQDGPIDIVGLRRLPTPPPAPPRNRR